MPSIKDIQQAVDPEAVDNVCDNILSIAYPPGQDPSFSVQALAYHRFIRFQIEDIEQENLQSPETTMSQMQGGHLDQIILLASMCASKEISCQVLETYSSEDRRYTLEVLVDNESEVQEIGVDARTRYSLRESKEIEGRYWTPADPSICNRPGDLEPLEQRDLIQKKTENSTNLYEWNQYSDRYRLLV